MRTNQLSFAPVGAAADAHRRMRGTLLPSVNVAAHEIVLAVDAEDARRQRQQVELPRDFAAAEDASRWK